jgi:hypothetical protein
MIAHHQGKITPAAMYKTVNGINITNAFIQYKPRKTKAAKTGDSGV